MPDETERIKVITSFPSLDTPVCDLQVKEFNKHAAGLSSDVEVIAVSMDLPFAQKRWCGAAGIDRVVTLSDHKDAAFGQGFGVLIKERRLLARAVFVVDRSGTVRYIQLVKEVGQEPDYEPVLAEARKLVQA